MTGNLFRKLLYVLLAIGLGAAFPFVSLGLFTDAPTVGSNTFSSGTIDITTSPTSALLSLSGLFPGDRVVAELTVTNNGTGALRYAMSTSVTESVLSAALNTKLKSGLTTCNAANMDDATLGTTVFSGFLNGAGFGNSAAGAHTGDRTLAAAANEKLCFSVDLATSAANTLQGISSTATFTFSAEQTKNN